MDPEQTAEQGQELMIEAYKQKRLQIFARNRGAMPEILNNQALRLRSKYLDCRDFTMFHVLVGGTPPECDKYDFPGDDSVVAFLDRLEQEFPEKSE